MKRLSLVVLAVLLVCSEWATAQTRPAPIYSLPPDGTWVEYEWVLQTGNGNKIPGTLRISSVGQTQVDNLAHRWVEIKLTARKGKKPFIRYRKLLINEQVLAQRKVFHNAVKQCWDRIGMDGPTTPLPIRKINDFLGMGLVTDAALHRQPKSIELVTKIGKFETGHVRTESNLSPSRDYRGWLTEKVPFGWAKFEIHERDSQEKRRIVFRAIVSKKGNNAQSEVSLQGVQ